VTKRQRASSEYGDIEDLVVTNFYKDAFTTGRVSEEFPNGFVTLHEEIREVTRTQHHFPSLPTFVNRLKHAYEHRWTTRKTPYKKVFALLVRWEEDDLVLKTEIKDLGRMFRDTYHFDTQTWLIPSGKQRYSALFQKVLSFLTENDGDETLFILYYGGHGYQDAHSQPIWVS
jgi:hypothetical protein